MIHRCCENVKMTDETFSKSPTDPNLNPPFFKLNEKTIRKYRWRAVEAISQLSLVGNFFKAIILLTLLQIHLDDRFENWNVLEPSCTLDGVDCPIAEPRRPIDPAFYSHKFKRAGLRYEVAVQINGTKIIWINGGVPCGRFPDLTLARLNFTTMLLPNERVAADKGYKDDLFMLPISRPMNRGEKDFNTWHRKILARHETVNVRLKQFRVLKQVFTHGSTTEERIRLHIKCFTAVANLTQLMLRVKPLMPPQLP